MQKFGGLAELAEEIDAHLRVIRRELRKPLDTATARGGLTAPQRSIMQVLAGVESLTLKELSRRAELAHSTVSGIVDRLEKRGLLTRQPDSEDGRFSRIAVTDAVRKFVRDKLPELAMQPLIVALRRSKPHERAKILEGLRVLRRALCGH
jgi:MarR family transcriptional regulator, organic hydroperoxide resistance regulator